MESLSQEKSNTITSIWYRKPEWWAVFFAAPALVISGLSALYSYQSLWDENALNRPYINIDASRLGTELHWHQSDPKTSLQNLESGAPMPWVSSISFDIYNLGKLPAAYYVDLNGLQSTTPGTTTILKPANNEGVIFPEQKITLSYNIQGIESSDQASIGQAIKNLMSPSQIKVFYGYIYDKQFNFETLIDEEAVQQNCDTIPTPGETCNPASWVVRAIK